MKDSGDVFFGAFLAIALMALFFLGYMTGDTMRKRAFYRYCNSNGVDERCLSAMK